MAIAAMNTTKTMERTSTALMGKCKKTAQEMEARMREAGCPKYETVDVTLPNLPGNKDDVVFVGLNGVGFHFLRGKRVAMPAPLYEILKNAGEI